MKIGQFVEVEYTGMLENGEVFDSTDPSKMDSATGPITVILGAGHLIKGVEKALLEMKEGEERVVDVPPEDGFGKRDAKKIKLYPMRAFLKEKVHPVPGIHITIDGQLGTVVSVTSGRVVVDFNHPLAGRKLRYHLKVLREVTDPNEQIDGLLRFHFGKPLEYELKEDHIVIYNVPEYARERLRTEIATYTSFKNVEFLEKAEKKGDEDEEHNQGGSGKVS